MSASLVGSEMCIRDRRLVEPVPCGGDAAAWRRRPTPRDWPQGGRWGPRPVSYTHLTLPTICSV
eukprot:2130598-Alexandrium_andersonii.AAC.1